MNNAVKSKALDEAIALVICAERDAAAAVKSINADIRMATKDALPALLDARREAEAEQAEHEAALMVLRKRKRMLTIPTGASCVCFTTSTPTR